MGYWLNAKSNWPKPSYKGAAHSDL